MTYMVLKIGKPESKSGKKITMPPSLNLTLEEALMWISNQYHIATGEEISSEELDEIQSRGELDAGDCHLYLDRNINAIGESGN